MFGRDIKCYFRQPKNAPQIAVIKRVFIQTRINLGSFSKQELSLIFAYKLYQSSQIVISYSYIRLDYNQNKFIIQ